MKAIQGSSGRVSKEQAKDTGTLLAIIVLLLARFTEHQHLLLLAVGLLAANLIYPQVFKLAAMILLMLSQVLGSVMSRVILTIIFILLVTPVGLVRRILGMDSLQLEQWKRGEGSVLKIRDHTFRAEDLENPY